jgi:hypothetical protein
MLVGCGVASGCQKSCRGFARVAIKVVCRHQRRRRSHRNRANGDRRGALYFSTRSQHILKYNILYYPSQANIARL